MSFCWNRCSERSCNPLRLCSILMNGMSSVMGQRQWDSATSAKRPGFSQCWTAICLNLFECLKQCLDATVLPGTRQMTPRWLPLYSRSKCPGWHPMVCHFMPLSRKTVVKGVTGQNKALQIVPRIETWTHLTFFVAMRSPIHVLNKTHICSTKLYKDNKNIWLKFGASIWAVQNLFSTYSPHLFWYTFWSKELEDVFFPF